MKQKEITSVIRSSFRTIDKYLPQIIVDVDEEAIHHFRTEIKKLRAFLRLLSEGGNTEDRLKLSKKIKVIYWYAGNIRNLQLHQKEVNKFLEKSANKPPKIYLEHLVKQLESFERILKTFIYPDDFNREKERIIKKLPGKFSKTAVKKFISQKIYEFKKLLTQLESDEMIHAVRKLLKDILYNWKYLKDYKKLLPTGISEKKEIESLTELLGNYCDKVTGINFLETYAISPFNAKEKGILQQIINKWQEEKNILRSQLYSMLAYNPE